jgi:hypothetical protein
MSPLESTYSHHLIHFCDTFLYLIHYEYLQVSSTKINRDTVWKLGKRRNIYNELRIYIETTLIIPNETI